MHGRAPGKRGLSSTPCGHSSDDPFIDDQRIYYGFGLNPQPDHSGRPTYEFVDWYDKSQLPVSALYPALQAEHGWVKAIQSIGEWIRAGPKPDCGRRSYRGSFSGGSVASGRPEPI
jgi:hypothetical protein